MNADAANYVAAALLVADLRLFPFIRGSSFGIVRAAAIAGYSVNRW
jgi:hypothetical protein